MKAIVYESHAGHTKAYAHLMGEKTGLPVYSLSEAGKRLEKGEKVLFMGWMMAGVLKGARKAKGRFSVQGACAVGMASHTEKAAEKIARSNGLHGLPVFMIKGGLDMKKLSPIYRKMMETLLSVLEKKKDRPADMQGLIDVARSDEDLPVTEKEIGHVLDWMGKGCIR